MQLWVSWAQPWLPHPGDVEVFVRLSTSCWSIWPTFSSSVMRWSRSFTRAGIPACEFRYTGCPAPGAAVTASVATTSAASSTATAVEMRLIGSPLLGVSADA